MREGPQKRWSAPGLVLTALVGVLVGVGAYTFQYGQGFSYFQSDPAACMNCHIMRPHFETWIKSSHGRIAGCVDCHLPARLPGSVLAKMENGWNHSWAFTRQTFHEPIQITPKNARILQENCNRCHGALVDQMLGHPAAVDRDTAIACVHCHAGVGHTLPPR
jgi:cytochrome c nitrite reductase small subunit